MRRLDLFWLISAIVGFLLAAAFACALALAIDGGAWRARSPSPPAAARGPS